MATIIDALIVTFGLDAKPFKKESKEVQESLEKTSDKSKKSGQDVADALDKKATAAMTRLKNEALAVTGVLLGATGLKDWIANTVQANVSTGNLSKSIGMSANDLNAWRRAAEGAGGNADDMQGALQAMGSALQEFRLSGKLTGPLEMFSQLGISATDAKGQIIGAQEAMQKIAQAMQGKDYQAVFKVLTGRMGFGAGAVPLLSKGAANLQQTLLDMHRIGDITNDAYQSSEKLNEEWVKLKTSVGSTASELEHKFEPVLARILASIRHVSESAKDAVKEQPGTTKPYAPRNNAAAHANPKWLDWLISTPSNRGSRSGLNGPPLPGGFVKPSSGADSAGSSGLFSSLEKLYGLPSGLLQAMFMQESGGGKHLIGPMTPYGKAKGPFQFMDDTANAYGVKNPFDLNQSANGAARMMRDLLKHYGGNLPNALAGYNWGAGKLDKNGASHLPTETRNYIASILEHMGASGAGGMTVNNETHIASIVIHGAKDANSIARDMKGAINKNSLVAQSDSGMR